MASRASLCNPSSISLFAASLLLSLALLVFAIAGGLHCFVTKTPDDEEGFASRLQTVTLLALLTIVLDWLLAYPLGYGVVLWTPSGWPVLGHLFAPLLLNRVVYFAIATLWHAALAMTASGVPALRLPDASEASALLGLPPGPSTVAEVSRAYKLRARATHPDKRGGSPEAFRAAGEARDAVKALGEARATRGRFAKCFGGVVALSALDWALSGPTWRSPWWAKALMLALPILLPPYVLSAERQHMGPALAPLALFVPMLTPTVLPFAAWTAWTASVHVSLVWGATRLLGASPRRAIMGVAFAVLLDRALGWGFLWSASGWARIPLISLIAPLYRVARFVGLSLGLLQTAARFGRYGLREDDDPDETNEEKERKEKHEANMMMKSMIRLFVLLVAECGSWWWTGGEIPTFGLQRGGGCGGGGNAPRAWWARHIAGWVLLLIPIFLKEKSLVIDYVSLAMVLTMHVGAAPNPSTNAFGLLLAMFAAESGMITSIYNVLIDGVGAREYLGDEPLCVGLVFLIFSRVVAYCVWGSASDDQKAYVWCAFTTLLMMSAPGDIVTRTSPKQEAAARAERSFAMRSALDSDAESDDSMPELISGEFSVEDSSRGEFDVEDLD